MLYDPKWQKTETKVDPFALSNLIAWLETRPAEAEYDFMCNGHCLLAQYFSAHGYHEICMGPEYFTQGDNFADRIYLPDHFNDIAVGHPRTFGAALERARAAVS